MTTSCLVSNYQQLACMSHALDSARAQTLPFDEIIVVVDGSTDGCVELLSSKRHRHSMIEVIDQGCQEPLSRFKQGFARATGDIIFLLDATDAYAPNYVQQVAPIYRRDRHCDLVLCGHQTLIDDGSRSADADVRDLDASGVLAAYARDWIGTPASCLSMRRAVMQKILTLPFPPQWHTRVADCLAFGASLVRARKCSLSQQLVYHRLAAEAQFAERPADNVAIHQGRMSASATNTAVKPRPEFLRQVA